MRLEPVGRRAELRAFCGMDLHWKRQYRGLVTYVLMAERSRVAFLDALAGGDFHAAKGADRFPSNGAVPAETLQRLDAANSRSRGVWNTLRRLTGGMARHLPGPIKAQLRRFF